MSAYTISEPYDPDRILSYHDIMERAHILQDLDWDLDDKDVVDIDAADLLYEMATIPTYDMEPDHTEYTVHGLFVW